MNYILATQPLHFEAALILIKQYLFFLGEDLGFQHIDEEYAALATMYAPPVGSMLLCQNKAEEYVGIVAIRNKENGICEMKRLYVLPNYNGMGIGKNLCFKIIETAKQLGYKKMVLDTLERLQAACQVYLSIGFKITQPYYKNPLAGVVFMEMDLV